MSCGVDPRRGLDPELLWLWCRPVVTAPIGPLAWESSHAVGVALEKAKRPKKKIESLDCTPETNIILYINDNSVFWGFFFCLFLGPHPQHVEVPRLGG